MHDTMIGGPVLTNWLAIVGVLSLMYWGFRIAVALRPRRARTEAEAPDAPAPARLPESPIHSAGTDHDIVVIAAAVHAMMGAHRIVRLESTQTGQTWAAEGRWMHQTSHRPG
jgi:hypothetical protein